MLILLSKNIAFYNDYAILLAGYASLDSHNKPIFNKLTLPLYLCLHFENIEISNKEEKNITLCKTGQEAGS